MGHTLAPMKRLDRASHSFPAAGAVAGASAQQNQPIYPAYDGFLKNPDGSYTLAFAYFSHNAERGDDCARRRTTLCADARRSHAADDVQAGPLALSVRDGGGPGVRRQDEVDADLRRRHDRHQRAHAAVELEPRRRRAAQLSRSITRKCRKACASIARRRCACSASPCAEWSAADSEGGLNEELNLFGSAHDEGLPRGKGLVVEWKMLEGPGHGEVHDSRRRRARKPRSQRPGSTSSN